MGVPEAKGVPVSMHGLITPGDVAPATVNRYLLPDERQVITVRKHPAVLIRPIISLILGLALAAVLTGFAGRHGGWALLVIWLLFIVFQTHQHYESYQIFGRCYPEHVEGLDPKRVIAEDVMYMALEDESGYLKLFPPSGGWRPGKYKVEIHIGWKINEISLIGTMRFTVAPSNHASSATVPQPK